MLGGAGLVVYKEEQKMNCIKHDYKNTQLFFAKSCYNFNGGLAIQCYTDEDGFPEPWSSVTTCLGEDPRSPYHAFIDVNNNGHDFLDWLEQIGAGKRTGRVQRSGFVVYPYFEFKKDFVDKLPYVEQVGY